MKTKILGRVLCLGIAAAIALPVAGTALAQQTLQAVHVRAPAGVHAVALLSNATGLTERQVQMVLGDRTSYAGYQTSYDFANRKFEKALGSEMYQHVKSQHELSSQDVTNLMAMANARKAG